MEVSHDRRYKEDLSADDRFSSISCGYAVVLNGSITNHGVVSRRRHPALVLDHMRGFCFSELGGGSYHTETLSRQDSSNAQNKKEKSGLGRAAYNSSLLCLYFS